MPPLQPGPLSARPAQEALDRLIEAHYDPEALGLHELAFSVKLRSKKTRTEARAHGRWKSGGPPELSLVSATREGKEEGPPKDNELARLRAWSDLEFKILKLVEGLSNGYLSARLQALKGLDGQSRMLPTGQLGLTFSHPKAGHFSVVVERGWVVRRIEVRSEGGLFRSMDFKHRMEKGRNLVTSGLLRSSVQIGSKTPQRAHAVMKAADRTLLEIRHAPAGPYLLSATLRKVIPATGEELVLKLTYTQVNGQATTR